MKNKPKLILPLYIPKGSIISCAEIKKIKTSAVFKTAQSVIGNVYSKLESNFLIII